MAMASSSAATVGAPTTEMPQAPLRGKLHQVKYLLEDANKRLHEEMANCEIFTTKTSAAAACSSQLDNNNKEVPNDLRRTISDISTLNSVLSCPIFNRIVNVADSLDKLSYHLNLHPSIGPADINLDANGELILAPPLEHTSLNNLINSKLDEFSNGDNMTSPLILNPNLVHTGNHNRTNNTRLEDHQGHNLRQEQQHQNVNNGHLSDINTASEVGNGFVHQKIKQHEQNSHNNHHNHHHQQQQQQQQQQHSVQVQGGGYVQPLTTNAVYDNEKLVSNCLNKSQVNGNNKTKQYQDVTRADSQDMEERQRLYKSNGHFNFDQAGQVEMRDQFRSTQSMNQVGEQVDDSNRNGYSNELYKTTHELNQPDSLVVEQQRQLRQHVTNQTNGQNTNSNTAYIKSTQGVHQLNNQTAIGKAQTLQSLNYNRSSCSPSTSAGSTVRLADECDSGASSLNQPVPVTKNGNNLYSSSQVYKMNDRIMDENHHDSTHNVNSNLVEDRLDSLEQDLLSHEMERIKVTLEKDDTGLGITIAGYTCEKEEISGIFIKSITPNSPADRSGKVRTLDQIFAVNGRELLGYNNKEAVKVLRHTGKVVTLELMRYLAESKFQKLQTALAHAVPTMNNSSSKPETNTVNAQTTTTTSNTTTSPTRSAIPISKSPTKPPLFAKPAALVQLSKNQQATSAASPNVVHPTQQQQQNVESIYKNDIVPAGPAKLPSDAASAKRTSISQVNSPQLTPDLQSHIPVAAQRGSGSIKVIETKQGARNTIDIRSPVCQTTTPTTFPTYVNSNSKTVANDQCDSAKKGIGSNNNGAAGRVAQNEAVGDDFGRLFRSHEPEWESGTQIIEISKDSSQSLGFTVKDYVNPKDPERSIIMITSLTPGGIAEKDGRLSLGDLLIFVDDINLEGASLNEAVRAFKKTSGVVTLGVLKLKRTLN